MRAAERGPRFCFGDHIRAKARRARLRNFGCGRSMIRRRVMLEEPYHRILYKPHPSAQLPPKAFVGLERAQFKQPSIPEAAWAATGTKYG